MNMPHYGQPPVTVVTPAAVGPEPARMTCPNCHAHITTDVKNDSTSKTHLLAFLLCLICPCGCCLFPYCCKSCMTATHSCPSCKHYLGTYTR